MIAVCCQMRPLDAVIRLRFHQRKGLPDVDETVVGIWGDDAAT